MRWFSKPVWAYLESAVSARRVKDAQLMLARYGDVLAQCLAMCVEADGKQLNTMQFGVARM